MIEIGSGGLNPSNRNAGFPNLARARDVDGAEVEAVTVQAAAELRAAGIRVVSVRRNPRDEVPSEVRGALCGWRFRRNWYYWVAEGPGIPVDEAEALHAAHGRVVRVAGDAGCPAPREYLRGQPCGLYHVDGPDGLRALANTIVATSRRGGWLERLRRRFDYKEE